MKKIFDVLNVIKQKLFVKKDKIHSEKYYRRIDFLNKYSLLIIDDLGAERKSEFMQEQVFNIIDARYRSGKPMIITTNLTAEEMKKPSEIGQGRIYDRILERCHPVEVKGKSIRREHLKGDFWQTEKILKGD